MIYTILNFLGDVLNVLGDVLSDIFISFVCVFVVLGVVYRIWRPIRDKRRIRAKKEKPELVVDEKGMPLLRPIPIPTKKDAKGLMRILVWLFEVRQWSLGAVWSCDLHDGTRNVTFVFHEGFKFDGASIPRIFWFLFNPIGILLIPGLIHDYAYKYDQLWEIDNGVIKPYDKGGEDSKRHRWDRLFWAVGVHVNGLRSLTFIAWLAIKIGGWVAWNKHRKKNEDAPEPVWNNSKSVPAARP